MNAPSFKNEKEFKYHLRDLFWGNGIKFQSEYFVGERPHSIIGPSYGCSGFIDFINRKEGWFIECKMSAGAQAMATALGQCLMYKHHLNGDYRAFVVYPQDNEIGDIRPYAEVFERHDIVLCGHRRLRTEIKRRQDGKSSYSAGMHEFLAENPGKDSWSDYIDKEHIEWGPPWEYKPKVSVQTERTDHTAPPGKGISLKMA